MPYETTVRDTAIPTCKRRACVAAVIVPCGFPHCPEEGAVKLKKKKKSYPEQLIGSSDEERGLRPPPFLGLSEIATNVFWMAGVWVGNGGVRSHREGSIRLL